MKTAGYKILLSRIMLWQQISLLPGNEGLSTNLYKEKYSNVNADFPLSLPYFLIQPCDLHSSVK